MQQIFRQWIGMHRAMIAWYHAAHHVTKGTGFGGDHVNIYGEIYTQLDEDLDRIVEKGIGLTGDETLADPVSSLSLAATMLAQYPMAANQNAEMIACSAFEISKSYVAFLEGVYSQFDACGMSLGLDDLLQGLANQYETYVYLLQQRSRGTSMKMTEGQLRRILRRAINESSGTIAPGDTFTNKGGRYNSRGRMIPRGGSEIHPRAQEAWDFICGMSAPNVAPSFWEDGKLMRFSPSELEALLNSLLGLSGPGYEEWSAGAYAADEFIEELEDLVQHAKENPEYYGE